LDTQRRLHIAFHLTGQAFAADLDPVDHLALRPALLARYRDLSSLRYDFPIVIGPGGTDRQTVQSLSGLMDAALQSLTAHEAFERITAHGRRLEREIRRLVANGGGGPMSVVWDMAAVNVGADDDANWRDSLHRLRAVVPLDGELLDCDAAMPAALFQHVWTAVQNAKARQFHDRIGRLIFKLSGILRADFVRSAAGRTAESLKASFGTAHEDVFDFDAMARVLAPGFDAIESLPEPRRRRIERLIQILESQRFHQISSARGAPPPRAAVPRLEDSLGPAAAGANFLDAMSAGAATPYAFVFDTCESALAAYSERAPQMAELARAIAAAELEVQGDYRDFHDAFFGEEIAGGTSVDPEELAAFPDYLVVLNDAALTPLEHTTLMEILAAGLPMKVLLQTDDLLDDPSPVDGPIGAGARARQPVHMAIGLNDVYVLQASASHLFQYRGRIEAGMRYEGTAIFSVFSGSTGVNDLSPYLVAAAAMESRAFPALVFDPSAGGDWASRFSIEGNSQVGVDWPVQAFSYEDESHRDTTADLAFTIVDFIACDPRYGRHFATVPRRSWNSHLVPAAETLASAGRPGTVPSLLMVDAANHLHKAVVGEPVMREARRCRRAWHSLQELAGIHNSHVERQLAQRIPMPLDTAMAPAAPAPPAPPAITTDAPAESSQASADDPYIETPRCTTCNECTGVNNVMFAYNANKQAYVANPGAGTYAQLVEAAESCQVSIIHPGKPRNPNEPGLAELLRRAEPFR